MLRRRGIFSKEFIQGSFHEYMLMRGSGDIQPPLPGEDPSEWLSLLFVCQLDRLAYANFDTSPITNAFERLHETVELITVMLQPQWGRLMRTVTNLQSKNARLFYLISEAGTDDFEELYDLSKGLIYRLAMINALFEKAEAGLSDFTLRVQSILSEIQEASRRLSYFSLRHFYTVFRSGKYYGALASTCIGSEFLRSVQGCLMTRLDIWTDYDWLFDPEHDYDMNALCGMEADFTFDTYEEATSVLLPEIVDLLF